MQEHNDFTFHNTTQNVSPFVISPTFKMHPLLSERGHFIPPFPAVMTAKCGPATAKSPKVNLQRSCAFGEAVVFLKRYNPRCYTC